MMEKGDVVAANQKKKNKIVYSKAGRFLEVTRLGNHSRREITLLGITELKNAWWRWYGGK